jgi:acyl carrier protein
MTNTIQSQNLKKEIKDLIAQIIEMEVDEINDDASFIDDLDVDSLKALEILANLEKKYRIEIPEEKLQELTTVNKTVEVARKIIEETC